jgi:hypothetical protein
MWLMMKVGEWKIHIYSVGRDVKLVKPPWKSVRRLLKILKIEYPMILPYHFWAYVQKNISQHTIETPAYPQL